MRKMGETNIHEGKIKVTKTDANKQSHRIRAIQKEN